MSRGARADDRFAVEAFEPAPSPDGSLLNVYGARAVPKRAYTFSALGSYARAPLSVESSTTGHHLGSLVGSIGTLSLLGTVGIWDHLDLGVALPLHRVGAGSEFYGAPPALNAAAVGSSQVALGDLRLVPRVSLLARQGEQGVGLALLTQVYVPTGKDVVYAGEAFRAEPRLALDWRSRRGLLLAMNVGYLVRRRARVIDAHIDDMLRAGLGVEVPIAFGLSALVEVDTQINLLSDRFGRYDIPTEGMLAARFRRAGWLAQIGAGPGLVRGMSAPRYRLFASVTFSGSVEPDSDGDGLLDKADRCPKQVEDKDGFEDEDGCPDPDDDGDGVPDTRDACRQEPEDHDDFEDRDGCPDRDNDTDGLADTADRCPQEPEDTDGFADEDGCPDPDNDEDGLADALDQCPEAPEDKDSFKDDDGCPDADNDGDGVVDARDRCPDEAGGGAPDGCPMVHQVVVTDAALELQSQLFFATNSVRIETSSYPLLDEIASVLTTHPEITQVLVEGHTDDSGTVAHNRSLSAGRAAEVVKALLKRGVHKARLRSAGVGPDRPVAANDSPEHRAQNRRVELHITARAP